ncbi:hypothetical protein EGT86_17795 [Burkholderia pseudomallei]|nr:hypothetical protein EGT86_17795 [Burkholderia pseudomallei]
MTPGARGRRMPRVPRALAARAPAARRLFCAPLPCATCAARAAKRAERAGGTRRPPRLET